MLCFLPHSLVSFSVSQNCDSLKLWLLYFFAAVALCCPTHLHCSQQQHKKPFFLETFHWVQTAVWPWQDRSLPCPCHLQRSKENCKVANKCCRLYSARALLELLCLGSAAQVSQGQQPQSKEPSGGWAPEGALLPLFSGDLAVSHLLCSFGARFSYWVISEGVSWVLKKWNKLEGSDKHTCSATKSSQHSKVTCACLCFSAAEVMHKNYL